jgi:hypothetical protein
MEWYQPNREALCFSIVVCLALLVLTLVSGCVFKEPYPAEWEELHDSSGECPDIAGVYTNIGQLDPSTIEKGQYSAYWEIPLTGELFYRDAGIEVGSTTHVEVTQPNPGAIEVTAWNKGELIVSSIYLKKNGNFTCKSGFVVFHRTTSCGGTPAAFGCGSRTDYFAKSTDGALILRVNERGVAAVMIFVPAAVSEWRWYRFELVTP